MKFGAMYDLAIVMAKKVDPRGKKILEEELQRIREEYQKMDKEKKAEFDMELLENPYSDSRILYGSRNIEIRRMIVGIDIDVGDVLLARELSRGEKKIDLVLAHHPEGKALIGLTDIMMMHEHLAAELGVPINVAEKLMSERIQKVSSGLAAVNHYKVVDAARLLDMPFMCLHTAADNHAHTFVQKFFEKKNPKYVGDVLKFLKEIPEFARAISMRQGPMIALGTEKSRCGKVAVTGMTAGTEGSEKFYEQLMHAGIGTAIVMHQSEKHKEAAEKAHLNVVISGHMPADSLGVNLILDEFEKKGVEIVPCGGFIRISRR